MFGKQKIVTYVDDGKWIDGEVVNEGRENESDSGNVFFCFFASFFSGSHMPDNNGSNTSPFQINYEAPQDNQGSIPVWDGYSGE